MIPGPEAVREALARWRKGRWLIPEAFAAEARVEGLEGVYHLSVEGSSQDFRWLESNGEPPPPIDSLPLPSPLPEGRSVFRVPGSERKSPCGPCRGAGEGTCFDCSGLGRIQCPGCRGGGCADCLRRGTADCPRCATRGKARCPECGGEGGRVRAHVLEIVRSSWRTGRTVGPAHPKLGPLPTRPVCDHTFPRGADATRLPASVPAALREAALDLLREADRPAGKSPRRRLRVEQVPVWSGQWSFGKRKGRAWFHGEPLSVALPFPPRNVFALATFVWLALMVPPGIFLAYLAFRPQPAVELDEVPPRAVSVPISLPPPPSAPLPVAPPKPPDGADDALVLLAQGGAVRGRLRSSGAEFVVADGREERRLQTWEIDTVLENAPLRIREKLEALAKREEEAGRAKGREAVLRALLAVHRERDSWIPLLPLCRAGELPEGESPTDRLDALVARLSRLLESPPVPPPAAVTPETPAPPAVPPPAPSERLAPWLALVGKPAEAERRTSALLALREQADLVPAAGDLLHAAILLLSRTALEWGIERDEVTISAGAVQLRHSGALEAAQAKYVALRLPQGGRVVAFREDDGAWFANLPGGLRVDRAEVTARRGVATAAGEALRAHLGRFPPEQWPALPPAEHARAAEGLIEGALAGQDEQGEGVLRRLAAAHASAPLRAGSPAEIERSRAILRRLGYAEGVGERWRLPSDHAALRGGALLRAGRSYEALSLFSDERDRSFPGRYRGLAARLLVPIASREELASIQSSVQSVLALARTEEEGRHVAALQAALSGYRVCARCGGDSSSTCSACRGKGSRRLTCGQCNGHAVVVRAGQGGGVLPCPSCKGKPDLGSSACGRCDGRGTVRCDACAGPFRMPRPEELCRVSLCPLCGGQGGLGQAVFLSCPACLGLGVHLVPAGRPDAVLR